MTFFQINMARSRVIPSARRRTWYRALILYLAFSGLLLVLLAGNVTRNLIAASDRRQQLSCLERQSLRSCPGHKDIAGYAAQAGANMVRYADTLESVAGVLRLQTQVAEILLGLASALSDEITLNCLDLDADKGEIVFEVWVPEAGAVTALTPPSLVSAWNRNPLLMAEVTQLTSGGSQRTQMNGRGFTVWRFTGRLPKKGG
ncbi:MAG: hypothetical protein WCL16_01605 [bacterium]